MRRSFGGALYYVLSERRPTIIRIKSESNKLMEKSVVKNMSNIDGRIMPTESASVPIMDRGFLYGDSVYEVFSTYDGVPLFMEEHFDRLENSARLIALNISQTREQLTDEIKRTVRASGAKKGHEVYVRYQITRGEGPIDLYPDPKLQTRYVIIVAPLKTWPSKLYDVGMTMAIPSVRRNPADALDPNIKGGNYLNNVIAVMQARELGADESLILSADGNVTEASNSNVWFVIGGEIATPSAGNLRGLTKAAIHKACEAQGVQTVERIIHGDELAGAEECFVSSATREVMPVRSLRLADGATLEFPKGGGERTRRIRSIYSGYVADYVKAHQSDCFFD